MFKTRSCSKCGFSYYSNTSICPKCGNVNTLGAIGDILEGISKLIK